MAGARAPRTSIRPIPFIDHATTESVIACRPGTGPECCLEPRELWPSWTEIARTADLPGAVLIDLHGESAWEKAAFASAIDGEVTTIVGTHTHDPTLRGHILPGGTGYVTELGMTGRLGFTGGGFDPVHFAVRLRGGDISALPPYELATGPMSLGAVMIDVDAAGRTTAITRIQEP